MSDEPIKQDSITMGSAAKDLMVKCYIDFKTMSDEEIKVLIRKVDGAYKYGKQISGR